MLRSSIGVRQPAVLRAIPASCMAGAIGDRQRVQALTGRGHVFGGASALFVAAGIPSDPDRSTPANRIEINHALFARIFRCKRKCDAHTLSVAPRRPKERFVESINPVRRSPAVYYEFKGAAIQSLNRSVIGKLQ
ncbi:hypothetical protein [Burkholderia puraquae]|uniref:hypothetical protein n=1 Tax=Burkholderia puraquae TaxID=1904757 RepID=UPI0010568A09|nr:hypothetical protein [Burkholderia puraquae]